MIPSRVRYAVLVAFICNGFFILTASYRQSYDAFTHMFFADHYAGNWWSLWDARWFGGFTVVSYPPLVHQLIGLLSHLTGIDAAYALIQWSVMSAYPFAIYAFSRIFLGRTTSSYAALGSAVLCSLYYAAFAFGQLPTLTATLLALLATAAFSDFLQTGNRLSGASAVMLTVTTLAAHHATLLFLSAATLAVVIHSVAKQRKPGLALVFRSSVVGLISVAGGFFVVWPFWIWAAEQLIQTPIDHLSRHNFFLDPIAFAAFFLPMYGPQVILIPFVLAQGFQRRFIGLTLPFFILLILGLGGTTPLPQLLFGKGWEWLTYDRFAFWASLMLVPFLGIFLIKTRRILPRLLSANLELKSSHLAKPLITAQKTLNVRSTITLAVFCVFAMASFLAGSVPFLLHTQPAPLDMEPIVNFLEVENRSGWKYLTFGFGDQMAYLSRLTDAATIDGSYFTARTLPELRVSGIAMIDTAFWNIKGLSALDPILQSSSEHGVRWGFVYRKEYIPILRRNGWALAEYLPNGVQVWENPEAVFPGPFKLPKSDPFTSFTWGTFPILSLITTMALSALRIWPTQAEKIMRGAYAFLLGLIPLSLAFWYYRAVGEFKHNQVYFIYDHALFFLSDGLAVVAIILWLAVKYRHGKLFAKGSSPAIISLFALCVLISLSTLWATDRRTAIYISLHFWLVFGLILSMRDWSECWDSVMLGLCALLSIEAVTGVVGFVTQSTALLHPLNMEWPGVLAPSTPGAITLKLIDSEVFLRAYGTLPHPNVLGGMLLFCLVGPIALFLRKRQQRSSALFLLGIGSSLLVLTFSRSAWLGTALFLSILVYRSKFLKHNRILAIILVMSLSFGLTLLPLRDLFFRTTTNLNVTTENFSVGTRVFLAKQAFDLIREHPWTGVGAGSFIIQLARRAGQFNYVEPVHNIPLLVTSELGIFGALLLLAIPALIEQRAYRNTEPKAVLAAALLAGMGAISLLDHYLWTLAPGRIMLAVAFGLWEGQTTGHETREHM